MRLLLDILALFPLGCLAYVVSSYAIVLAQRPRAPVAAILRSAAIELVATLTLLPFWPLWMVLGAAYEVAEEGQPGTAKRPIILLHGFMLTQTCWLVLGHRLRRRGLGPLYATTYWSLQSVRASAEELAAFVDEVCARHGVERVDIVAHSMGGVVARYFIERLDGARRLGRLITIASPHKGTRMGRYGLVAGARDLVADSSLIAELGWPRMGVPYTSIWSRSDSVILPQASSSIAPAGEDCVFDDLGHLSLLASRRVTDAIVERLRYARR